VGEHWGWVGVFARQDQASEEAANVTAPNCGPSGLSTRRHRREACPPPLKIWWVASIVVGGQFAAGADIALRVTAGTGARRGTRVELEEVGWGVILDSDLIWGFRPACIVTKSRKGLIDGTLEFSGVLWGEKDVANNSFLFVQNDVLFEINRVEMHSDGQTIL
jgi:hypothetical protein